MTEGIYERWLTGKKIGILKKKLYKVLRLFYGFGEWHISPINEREYAIDVVKYVNSLNNKGNFILNNGCIVEIGCGLGEIIGNIRGENKLGYDKKQANIAAAKVLHPNTSFFVGGFETVRNKEINVLLMVNFIHEIKPCRLKRMLDDIFKRNRVKYVIIDVVTGVDYKYKHDGNYLLGTDYELIDRSKGYSAGINGRRWIEVYKQRK